MVVYTTVHSNITITWHIDVFITRFSRIGENYQHQNTAVDYNNFCYHVESRCPQKQRRGSTSCNNLHSRLRSTNRVAVFQVISARMITRLLELPIPSSSIVSDINTNEARILSKETWLSCIIIEISASASLRRSVRKMKDYLWILNFRQRRSLCILAAQHLQNQLNGRGQR